EFSSNIATALVCLATNRAYNFSKMIFDGLVKNVTNKVSKFLMYPRVKAQEHQLSPHHTPSQEAQPSSHTHISSPSIPTVTSVPTILIPTVIPSETTPIRKYTQRARIAQSFALPPIAGEPASPVRDDSQKEACPTDSSFIADQDRATIAKPSTLPHDSAPRVTSHVAEEGSMQQSINELTALCTSLQRQHSELLVQFQAQEVEINRLKERVTQLEEREGFAATNSGDDAPIKGRTTVLASGVVDVPTGSGSIPTASTPAEGSVPTGSERFPLPVQYLPLPLWLHQLQEERAKRELEEQLEKEDQRRAEQIARDAEIARIHAKEELQSMIDGLDSNNETVAKYLEEYRFIPMGSKEEAGKIKRKGINLEQESAKKQKSSEEITEEAKSPEEVPEEKVKEMMNLVPIEEGRLELTMEIDKGDSQHQTTYNQRQRNLYACGEGLPSEEGSSTCDDLLQTLSGELLTYGK
nr:synaptobrevin, longin-like domain protein [Tanacetum cinerariifolium]